ncbi:MAG: nucleotidyltransferase domain-containing protein [Chloroflexi bacterium]|nr:nucleotidyltransferase domain-containing protein [Chloroflexota bacterium]MBI4296667.1 nucleotidyltransferase domain-containing protein [Chloroflexota bacterium]
MEIHSIGSVTIIWLDRKAAVQAVKQAVRRLARRRPEIRKVVLFGSLARGDAVPGSDADLLVVLADSDRPFLDRMPLYRPTRVPVGVDVFPYTEEELTEMIKESNAFVKRALSEGMVIFERRGENGTAKSLI